MISVSVFLVFVVFVFCILRFNKISKQIERKLDTEHLEDVQKDILVFEKYLEEEKNKTPEKLKKLKTMKGKYHD